MVKRKNAAKQEAAQLIHPEDAERVKALVREALAQRKEASVECRIVRPNGEIAWIFARGQVQCDEAGKPVRAIGIVQDITEQEHAEKRVAGTS